MAQIFPKAGTLFLYAATPTKKFKGGHAHSDHNV